MMLAIYHTSANPHYFYVKLQDFKNSETFLPLQALFKRNGGKYDRKNNLWILSCGAWSFFVEELSSYFPHEQMQFHSDQTLSQILKESETSNELVKSSIRATYKTDMLVYPVLKGKSPNEHYQAQDITKSINQNRYLLNLDPGLGKSLILTYIYKYLKEKGEIQNVLILTTKIGVDNLKYEIMKFYGPALDPSKILTMDSVAKIPFEKRDVFSNNNYEIIVTTHGTLKYISNYYYDKAFATPKNPHPSKKKYKKMMIPFMEWFGGKKGCIMIDESHYLGNPKAEQTRIILGHADCFYYRYLFTGTLASKFEKLYCQLKVMDPFLVHHLPYEQWCALYNEVGNSFSEWAINPLKWKRDRLELLNQKMLKNYASRRKLTECLDLPPNIDMPPIIIQMHPLHRQIYENFVENYFELLVDDLKKKDPDQAMAKSNTSLTKKVLDHITVFQGCVDNPQMLLTTPRFNELKGSVQRLISSFDFIKHQSKLEVISDICVDRLDEGGDTKGIIWYIHPTTGQALHKAIKRKHLFIYRGMKENMMDVINRFKVDDSQLLILSLLMCNTSVTITESQFMIFAERNYSADDYKQARLRQGRPGQTEVTRNYSILFDSSLDMLQENILTRNSFVLENFAAKGFITQAEWSSIFNMKRKDVI